MWLQRVRLVLIFATLLILLYVYVPCRPQYGQTALVLATTNGHTDVVEYLMRQNSGLEVADKVHVSIWYDCIFDIVSCAVAKIGYGRCR